MLEGSALTGSRGFISIIFAWFQLVKYSLQVAMCWALRELIFLACRFIFVTFLQVKMKMALWSVWVNFLVLFLKRFSNCYYFSLYTHYFSFSRSKFTWKFFLFRVLFLELWKAFCVYVGTLMRTEPRKFKTTEQRKVKIALIDQFRAKRSIW